MQTIYFILTFTLFYTGAQVPEVEHDAGKPISMQP